jgi:hypothetical protein
VIIGVCGHIGTPDYDPTQVVEELNWLGVNHFRTAWHPDIAKLTGIRVIAICNTLAAARDAVECDTVRAIEGINEPNNTKLHPNLTLDDLVALSNEMADLAEQNRKQFLSSALSPGQYPPKGTKPFPMVTLKAHFANFHSYPNGEPVSEWRDRITSISDAQATIAGVDSPRFCTEFGSHDLLTGGLDPAVAATQLPQWLSALRRFGKASRAYWYELNDQVSLSQSKPDYDRESTFGLFRNGEPKPTAYKLKELAT